MKLVKSTKILLSILCTLLAATVGAGIYYATLIGHKDILMPQLVGSTREQVDTWVQSVKLTQDQLEVSYAFDDTVEYDVVLSQSIPEGEPITKDSVLVLVLSQGEDPSASFTLPDFKDKKQEAIQKWFDENGFKHVTYVFAADEKIDKDLFINSDPKPGTKLTREDKVTITISTGKDEEENQKEVTVPDFSTYTLTNMRAWGTTNRITISVLEQESETIGKGQFISQSVKAGTKVKTGSTITITLSSGKAIPIENMVGKTRKEAEAWASRNNIRTVFNESYSTLDEGIILTQNPASGNVSGSSVITYTISIGRVKIADYTGKSRDSFQSYINGLNADKNGTAKIALSVTEQESDQAAGTILSQSASGAMDPGSSITITVAVGKKVNISSKAGSSLEEFKKYLSNNSMSLGNVSYSYSDSVAKGTLISNDTGTYPAGSSIHCVVSNGPYTFDYSPYINAGNSYPTLVNKSTEARNYGYTVNATYETSETYDKDIIVRACSVNGKNITCPVSSGKVITVPSVIGKQKDEAVNVLQNAGFKTSVVVEENYSDVTAGQVVAQDPKGSKEAAGTTVMLTVSKGPAPKEPELQLPNIQRNTYSTYNTGDSAESIGAKVAGSFTAKGFKNINIVYVDTSNGNNANYLMSISPDADGSYVAESTVITITVGKGTN